MQLAKNTEFVRIQKIPPDNSTSELLTKYIDNIKSMSSSSARQYKSELNNFVNFVYKTYDSNIDSFVDKILYSGYQSKKTTLDPYDVLSKYTASLIGTIAPIGAYEDLL